MSDTTPPSQRPLQFGTWLQTGSSIVAELADACGFDWLLIDLEHGCGTDMTVLPQLQVIRRAAAIVRVPTAQPDLIARALDWGAAGIMVPMVSTAEKAEACVRAMHYPPRGDRGLAGMVRAYRYGLEKEPATPHFFAQIETIEAVKNARAIAAVEGVDVLFVGPMDLQLNLKAYPEHATLDYVACLREVATASKLAGKACGILLKQTEDISSYHELGFTHPAVETDITFLRDSYLRVLSPWK
ncbi:2-dehydro-3-deoxyglucarate aldolase/4-hydroxy-2-oxoheptanedioate aldolase [Roseimicrobium gellanilyticum]|uniref:2-dehydro-3-deoxyglucarate aldolase/4-hydroxy-2-oxoheptanedioate aldolase n=1 Tax=Roseimicrobium gellanilyticum TaxID=748857 RepID=A0A366H9I8_9BACT|nr:aldolase/citrate lyase family protein [Roseimicrobium gellanilyticum]RBP38093.1 2-dehydro-3-deoxyglucarate aldolase/4-hydroxy-2-oxoheptanedioate aldolase [Roseimicrobium gellanilyticum]